MHELSIAMSIVELAEQEAEARGATIEAVYLQLGPLSGVVKEALLGSYEIACAGTVLEGSRLVIEDMPIVARCAKCQAEKTLPSMQSFLCPECGTPMTELVHGKELHVTALEIRDAEVKA